MNKLLKTIWACRGGKRHLRLGRHRWWCVHKHAHARRGLGACSSRKIFKIRCSEIASKAIIVLDAGPKYFWNAAHRVQELVSRHCTCSSYRVWFERGQKGHRTRHFERGGGGRGRGALKGKFLSRGEGGHTPLVLPPSSSAAYDVCC